MKNVSNKVSTGMALLLTIGIMIVIGLIISAFEPRCSMSGCDKHVSEGDRYCVLHEMSYRSYGNPDYNEVYENSQKNKNAYKPPINSSDYDDNSSSTTTNRKPSSDKKTYNTYDSYDEGYEDIYDNDDYDMDRYYNDDEYAAGVDDAMDELDW